MFVFKETQFCLPYIYENYEELLDPYLFNSLQQNLIESLMTQLKSCSTRGRTYV